jgi:3-methyladenine DNA glycosylase Mpg
MIRSCLYTNKGEYVNINAHCVQTDSAKNVWIRAYLIPERNRTVRMQEEGKNS